MVKCAVLREDSGKVNPPPIYQIRVYCMCALGVPFYIFSLQSKTKRNSNRFNSFSLRFAKLKKIFIASFCFVSLQFFHLVLLNFLASILSLRFVSFCLIFSIQIFPFSFVNQIYAGSVYNEQGILLL